MSEGLPNPLDDGLGVFRHCHAGILEHIDRISLHTCPSGTTLLLDQTT